MNFPNILIVTSVDIFQDDSSSSMTVRSFFEGIPTDNIFQLICNDSYSTKRGRISNNIFCLNRKDIRLYPRFKERKTSSRLIQPIDQRIEDDKFSIKKEIIGCVKDILSILPYIVSSELKLFIREAKISLIYTCSFNPRCYTLIEKISKITGVKHTCHFLDDWPNIQYLDSFIGRNLLRARFDRNLHKYIHNSPFSLCISELMCEEYKARYNYQNFIPLMHSVNSNDHILRNNLTGRKRIIYAGSLYLERYVSLIEFCKCVKRYELNGKVDVIVYTKQAQWEELNSLFIDYPFLSFGGFISHDKLMEEISNSDALLLVESMKEEMLEYTRLSMSTKIPEFLSSGKPIFAIGNSKQGSIAYLKKHKAAFVVDDLHDIDKHFVSFMNEDNISTIIDNARDLFLNNHTKEQQKSFFLSLVNKLIQYE